MRFFIDQDTVVVMYYHRGTGMYSSGAFFGKIVACLGVMDRHGLGDADVRIGKDAIVMEGVDCLPELRRFAKGGAWGVNFSCVGSFSAVGVHE